MQRPGSLTPRERAAEQNPPEAKCCVAAPPVLLFDQSGNLIRHWGGAGAGYEWPESEHGIFIDDNDFVWLAGNGKKDGQLLKFTMDGKFVLQIGQQGDGNDSNATAGFARPRVIREGGVRGRRLRQSPCRRQFRTAPTSALGALASGRATKQPKYDRKPRRGSSATGSLHPSAGRADVSRANNRMQVFARRHVRV